MIEHVSLDGLRSRWFGAYVFAEMLDAKLLSDIEIYEPTSQSFVPLSQFGLGGHEHSAVFRVASDRALGRLSEAVVRYRSEIEDRIDQDGFIGESPQARGGQR